MSSLNTNMMNTNNTTVSAKTYDNNGKFLHVAFTPETDGDSRELNVIVALDRSGSMETSITSGEGTEKQVVSRLFLAKHAIRAIALLLGEKHNMSIISFDNEAELILPMTKMDASGIALVDSVLKNVTPRGSTNMFDAINMAVTEANKKENNGKHITFMLLTDGYADTPRRHATIMGGLQSFPKMTNPWTVHTFGFGIDLDSRLLVDIANWGGGLFGFIPSGDMLGTVLINAIANRLSVSTCGTKVTCIPDNGTKPIEFFSGPIRFGQERNFIFPATASNYTVTTSEGTTNASPGDVPIFADARYNFINAVKTSINTNDYPLVVFADTYKSVEDYRVNALVRDVSASCDGEGQVGMAHKYASTWGLHYLRSYTMAQELEECMNFKDPGLQIYGGALFSRIQEEGDKAFINLKPLSEPVRSYYGSTGYLPSATPPVNMAAFHNQSGSCFAGHCLVLMANGSSKPISQIRRGDVVHTLHGPTIVRYAIEFNIKAKSQPMCQIGNLCITPWHPILENNVWIRPVDKVGYTDRLIQTVYNLILENNHTINVEQHWCITLGHGQTTGILYHPFFASIKKVLGCLQQQPGFSDGRPVYQNCVSTKDENNIVSGWINRI